MMQTLLKHEQKETILQEILGTYQNVTSNEEDVALQKKKMTKKNDDLDAGNILESLLNNCFEFAYSEGLSYENVGKFLRFYHQLIQDSAVKELPVSEVALLVKQRTTELAVSRIFKDLFVVSAVEFISKSLLQHYHLIVFALCYSRQQEIHMQNVLVEVAPYEVDALKSAKQADQWKLEIALEKEEKIFVEEEQILQDKMADTINSMETELENYFTSLSNLEEVNVDMVADIVQNIVSRRGEITTAELEFATNRSRALMSKNMALMTIQSSFKDSVGLQVSKASPSKRMSSPGKKNNRK